MRESTTAGGIAVRGYEISTAPGDEGVLLAASPDSTGRPRSGVKHRCHELFWDRAEPCPSCPFLPPPPEDDDRVRSAVIGFTASDGALAIVVGRRASGDAIRVVQHAVGDDLFGQLVDHRLERASSEARLSPREREALRLLMMGRSLREIATALSITVRTAKYHQANILEKLGADSRLDLLRLLSVRRRDLT